ncbi:flagellar type III secretion system pore protein FliP [Pontivivens insulae]|uniref:Flagellar biosynthetic protein FliP n=1 Tax=Pontivivens insulae TaxID=1639689 RepID=A0A2R8A9Z7_9RHOB|nr:flagellar type III secretion system pore protein FliP [Pontivivens insulae]RED12940.1 flagellar biosynthetic protein FliP [Pontivivens insulae]SPF29033.1 Flagellar biosynthetic protein FliP [Pontivivens insulae]
MAVDLRRVLTVCVCLMAISMAAPAHAQSLSLDLGEGGSVSMRTIQLFLIVTVLSLAPGLAIMLTCFPFMIIVLSMLRQAIGVQQAPPNMLLVSLALFLTWFVMEPVFAKAWANGLQPFSEGQIEIDEAFTATLDPFRVFMSGRVDPGTLSILADARGEAGIADLANPPLDLLVPSFLLGEVQRGFEIGFLIFIPFLVIDLVIAAILMSMGMMMVPPAIVSMPFKLAFFVLADGWALLAGALVGGYAN